MSKHRLGVEFDIDEYQWGGGDSRAIAISELSKRDLQQALCYCMDALSGVSEDISRAMKRIEKYERGNIEGAL